MQLLFAFVCISASGRQSDWLYQQELPNKNFALYILFIHANLNQKSFMPTERLLIFPVTSGSSCRNITRWRKMGFHTAVLSVQICRTACTSKDSLTHDIHEDQVWSGIHLTFIISYWPPGLSGTCEKVVAFLILSAVVFFSHCSSSNSRPLQKLKRWNNNRQLMLRSFDSSIRSAEPHILSQVVICKD